MEDKPKRKWTAKKDKEVSSTKSNEITPKKDHVIIHNDTRIELKKGVPCEVPKKYIPTLEAEKVI